MTLVKAENVRKNIPLVSIIAICYNHSKYVVETLGSILNQTYENIELIIIDSNSPDNSVEVIQNWIDQNKAVCTFIRQSEPKNICQNLNEGLGILSGKYFFGLSCDDIILEDKIKGQVSVLEQSGDDVSFVFSDANFIDDNSKIITQRESFVKHHSRRVVPDFDNLYDNLIKRNFIPAMSVLLKTDKVKRVGYYDEKLDYEDYDMWLRLLKNGDKAIYMDEVTCLYRMHENNLHFSEDIDWSFQDYAVIKKHIDHPEASRKIRNFIEWAHQRGEFDSPMMIDYRKSISTSIIEKLVLKYRIPYNFYDKFLKILKK